MEDKEEKRKASEVIIELERKIDLLIKMVANHSNNNVLILSKVNELNNKLDKAMFSDPKPSDNVILNYETENIFTNHEIIGTRRTARAEANPGLDSQVKVAVHQLVMDLSEKPMILADVEVISDNNDIVVKTRTSASGRWQGALQPGKYTINILKRETGSRKRIEYKKEVVITGDRTPYELEPAKLA